MPEPLTERQNEAYEFILAQVRDHRAVPTLREIGQALDIRSPNAVTKLVRALVAKGYLLHTPHAARGLRLADAAAALGGSASEDAPLLPLVGRASAAQPEMLRRRPERFYAFDAQLLPRTAAPEACLMVRAGDDGMNADGLRKGDLVVVLECDASDLRNGDLGAFLVGETVQIRTFHLANGKWHLRPADRRYTEETYLPGSPQCHLIGRALALVRRLA